ncbi:MAG: InlB B-repeat-containing protein [Methanocorpusculum sp.]|nr:InlB B-repeat-containing protein [Methanocorpusculum sp.]
MSLRNYEIKCPLRKAGVLLLAALLACVLMAGAVSAVENNYYNVPAGTTWSGYNITSDFMENGHRVNFTDLISAITYARPNVSSGHQAVFYCKPGAVIYGAVSPTYSANHPSVNFSFTMYGNGASVAHSPSTPTGEFDFSIDTYEPKLTSDITLNVYNLTNVSFWGQRTTTHTLSLFIDGCTFEGSVGYPRIYLSGATGKNNIQIQNTKFLNANRSVIYSNAAGEISLKDCSFTNNPAPFNINHKATSGTLKITLDNCSFTDCGEGTETVPETYSAPVRVVNSENSNTVSVEIVGCSFNNQQSSNGDILLGDGREGKTSKGITTTIKNLKTAAYLQVQNPGERTASGYQGYSEYLNEETNYQVTHTGSGTPSVDIIIPQPEPQPQPVVSSSGDGNMNNAFRVLFETNGGGFISPATDLSYGDRVAKPADPVKDGCTFAGWYKDAACTQSWSFSDSIPGDMTLYAKWTSSSSGTEATAAATTQPTAKATTAPTATQSQTAAATTAAPVTTTAAGVSPTLTQAPAPVFGALFGLLIAGVLLRRRA